MADLESVIEKKLIEQLVMGESQWTYRPDLNNEEKLWANFRYILEHNVTCSSPFSCAKKIIPGLECLGIRCRI